MSTIPWTTEEKEILREYTDTYSSAAISTIINNLADAGRPGFPTRRSPSAVRHKLRAITDFSSNNDGETSLETEIDEIVSVFKEIEKIQSRFYEGQTDKYPNLFPASDVASKYICISDAHIPFSRQEDIRQILLQHRDADGIILDGDMIDGYAFSSFTKSKKVATIYEYRAYFKLVALCTKLFKNVWLTEGNHEDRVQRALYSAGFGKEHAAILRPNLVKRIINGEELDMEGNVIRKHNFDNIHFNKSETWWVKVGKTLFIHPSSKLYSKPGHTVATWNDMFLQRFGLDYYDSIVCGHTHMIYKGIISGKLLIEQGCMAGYQSYSWNKRQPFLQKAMNGYSLIYQDVNGNTQFNLTGPQFIGSVAPPDPTIH